ncbi:MAG TPA: prolyl oligopeptidase family serine peptidase [Flavisolibacter sp.]|nr:prolyl oligopeptidase family serine peptidase [Flavisolibacter sp.]
MIRNLLLAIPMLLLALTAINAQDFSAYQKKWVIRGTDTLPYRLLLPENYSAKKKYPLILFMHGSGERGRDNEKQLLHGGDLFLKDSIRKQYQAIVVFPQCPEGSTWAAGITSKYDSAKNRTFIFQNDAPPTVPMQLVQQLLAQLQKDFPIDKKRIYVGGLSMGGMGTYDLVRRNPTMFAAAFPICGAADPSTASQLTKPSWWIFHGALDNTVPPMYSQQMADALKKAGADVHFTLYPNASHNSWDSAFAEPGLMPWLFSKHR